MKAALGHAATMFLFCCTLIAPGCASSPTSRFYTLAATSSRTANAVGRNPPSVAVVWVTVPELIDRPQLVVNVDESRVEILETHRWAEPLKSAISRTIAEDISRILVSDRVSSYPQTAAVSADFKVYVDLQRFELAGDHVLLDAFWTIRSPDEKVTGSGRSRQRETLKGGGYEARVSAINRGLDAVSRDIARELQKQWAVKVGA